MTHYGNGVGVRRHYNKLFPVFVFAALVLVGVYSMVIEPYWVELTSHQVPAPIRSPLRILHLTDLHSSGLNRNEQKAIRVAERTRPDIIVITGDLISDSVFHKDLSPFLNELRAPLGVFVTKGNWENWYPAQFVVRDGHNKNYKLLDNQSHKVTSPSGDTLTLVGLDDSITGAALPEKAFEGVSKRDFVICLFHSPDYFRDVADRCPIALSGHTHGGQVRLPLLPPFWLPRGSGNYVSGWYRLGKSQMYVNRGLGTSLLPVRLFARPEILLLELVPE